MYIHTNGNTIITSGFRPWDILVLASCSDLQASNQQHLKLRQSFSGWSGTEKK